VGQGPYTHEISRLHTDAPHSVGLLWTSDLFAADTTITFKKSLKIAVNFKYCEMTATNENYKLFCTGVKLGVSHQEKNIGRGCSGIGC